MTTVPLHSVDEVATLLGLNVRTVRNYVRDGRLPAVRIGKQYRIAREDVDKLTGGRTSAAPEPSVTGPARVEVSAIVQVEGIDGPTMARLSTLVSGAVVGAMSDRSGDAAPLHVETVYDPQRRTVKVVALGGADDTARLLSLIGAFAEGEL